MRVPKWLAVGVCSHPGHVRRHNEDDYLLGALVGTGTLLAAVADGMGGLAGGAEASRSSLRALGAMVLDGGSSTPLAERLLAGYTAAGERVRDEAAAVPALRDMGTTLTALCLADGQALVGHIGDTRLYRVRRGHCEVLTVDHAVREPDNLLTRCIGAGQPTCTPDHAAIPVRAGDRFLLVSDGVWSVLATALFARLAAASGPQAAAEALVGAALAAGGPDNATAIVVEVVSAAADADTVDVDLPRHERPSERQSWPPARSLRPPRWPWLLLLGAALVALDVVTRGLGWGGAAGVWHWCVG